MIRSFLIFTFLTSLIVISQARECRPNFCDTVKCASANKEDCLNAGKDFRPRDTSQCICCDICLDYRKIGEPCGPSIDDFIPHKCVPKATCVKGTCHRRNKNY